MQAMDRINIEALMERMKMKSKTANDERAELKRAHDQVEDLYRTPGQSIRL